MVTWAIHLSRSVSQSKMDSFVGTISCLGLTHLGGPHLADAAAGEEEGEGRHLGQQRLNDDENDVGIAKG